MKHRSKYKRHLQKIIHILCFFRRIVSGIDPGKNEPWNYQNVGASSFANYNHVGIPPTPF